MASLNWVVLDHNTLKPVPLPREKILVALESVSISISISNDATLKADKGTVYLSNQRVVYVAPPVLAPSSTTGDSDSDSLETLSVPYSHFKDGHFHQPFFGANYYQATCIPAQDGGLAANSVVRLYFKEGGGFDFYSTVLEMSERLASQSRRNRAAADRAREDLPLYSATPPTASRTSSSASSTRPHPSGRPAAPRSAHSQPHSVAHDAPHVPAIGHDAPPSYAG